MILVPGTLFYKRGMHISLYVLMKVVGTRLYRCRLAVPVDMCGSVSSWEQLEEQYLTSMLPGLRKKKKLFKIYLVLALTKRSCTVCSTVEDSA